MIADAVSASSGRLNAMMPPNAEVGSVRYALSYAARIVARDGDAAGIRVLDDDAGGRFELPHAFERGIGVRQVVEREFLALQLRGRADARALRVARDVERGLLVRVLAVAQVEPLAELQRQQVGEVGRGRAAAAVGAHGLRQVRGDHRVVLRRVRIRLGREPQAGGIAHAAVFALHLGEHRAVVERIDHDGDAVMVLGRGAHHRRSADVDVLDGVLEGAARLGDGRGERIQVDDDEVDRLDAVLAHDGVVGAAPAEQAAVDLRVQGLDPPVHDLGEAGDRRHVDRVDAFGAQQPGRAAGRDDLHAAASELVREFEQAFLVRDADERALDRWVHGRLSLRCRRRGASCAACRG